MLTVSQLARICENPDPVAFDLKGDLEALVPEMRKAGITTKKRVAAFFGNVGVETDYLKTLEEYGDEAYWRHGPTRRPPAVYLGAEWRYHGRGYLQNTWRAAYAALSEVLGVDLVARPDLLSTDKRLAAKAAVWYWRKHGLNSYADRGEFRNVASIINTGQPGRTPNHWEDRLRLYNNGLRVLPEGWSLGDEKEEQTVADKPAPPGEAWKRTTLVPPNFRRLAPKNSGSYQDRHPTRYEWREDVKGLIRRAYREFPNIHISTYFIHPGDEDGKWARDTAAFDVWGAGGRNDPLPRDLGDRVFGFLYDDPNPPDIDWIIWERTIRIRSEGFRPKPFGTEPFSWHEDHIHVTYTGAHRLLR